MSLYYLLKEANTAFMKCEKKSYKFKMLVADTFYFKPILMLPGQFFLLLSYWFKTF